MNKEKKGKPNPHIGKLKIWLLEHIFVQFILYSDGFHEGWNIQEALPHHDLQALPQEHEILSV